MSDVLPIVIEPFGLGGGTMVYAGFARRRPQEPEVI
jgi:hypothetical protein